MQQFSRGGAQLPKVRKSAHHYEMERQFTERSLGQWALAAALAFAERAGIVICGFLFLFNENRDFWTFWGLVFVLAHIFILSPVYGILVYLTERLAYHARRWIGRPIVGMGQLKTLGRAVHVFWFPLMWLASSYMFEIFDRLAPSRGFLDFWRAAFT